MEQHQIVRRKRRELEMTQQQLADRIGMSQAMIQHYENGRSGVSSKTLEKILNVLDLKLEL
ncbi:hypothetical protein LCGC14_2103650 [marine sediment metagenome]|uniref:HTH cro/C1-type domain-containing protein n=1 Tax=marine sediment metagenome TaxID=412755 RepID=A0A0F9EWC1_9ZZZZ